DVRNKVEGLKAVNVYDYDGGVLDRKKMVSPEAGVHYAHPVARTHPATGRKALYVNRLMTHSIVGLPKEESDRLLSLMFDTLERPESVYKHRWRVGDVLVCDNRCNRHVCRYFVTEECRWMRRVTVDRH